MLVIKSIKFKYNKQIGTQRGKGIRLSYGTASHVTKKRAHQLDGHTTEWRQNISMPIFFNRPIDIEIFQPNNQNYNPEEQDTLLKSSVRILNFKQLSSEGIVENKRQQKMGTLLVNYEIVNEKMLVPEDTAKGQILISSVLVHVQQCSQKTGFVEFVSGSDSVCTTEIQFLSNELLSSDQFVVKLIQEDLQKGFVIRVHTDGCIRYKLEIDISTIKNTPIKYKRISLHDLNNRKAGYIFIDMVYRDKYKAKTKTKRPQTKLESYLPILPQRYSQGALIEKPLNKASTRKVLNSQSEKIIKYQSLEAPEKRKKKIYNFDLDKVVGMFNIGELAAKRTRVQKLQKLEDLDLKNHPVIFPRPMEWSTLILKVGNDK